MNFTINMPASSFLERFGELSLNLVRSVQQVWLLAKLESEPVSRPHLEGSIKASRRWTRSEMDTLIHLYMTYPLWSYRDIASRLYVVCPNSYLDEAWSAEECSDRLRLLHDLSPETFGTEGSPPRYDPDLHELYTLSGDNFRHLPVARVARLSRTGIDNAAKAAEYEFLCQRTGTEWNEIADQLARFTHTGIYDTPEPEEIESLVKRFQPSICKDCVALNLGASHMEAMTDFGDWWSGPETGGHPANKSLHLLQKSTENCRCCEFMYNAVSERLRGYEVYDYQTRLGVFRGADEHFLEIKIAENGYRLALLRMVHCKIKRSSSRLKKTKRSLVDDWLPFRYCPNPQDANSLCTIARVVPEVPDLEYIAQRIRSFQRECEIRHCVCGKMNDTDAPLPPRVLLITEEDSRILVQLKDSRGQHDRYTALSYVWGGPGQFKFTAESEQSLRAGMEPTVFAKTICEAIQLTHALGFRYIWIDALCIQQDSPSDWQEQSTLMGQVYGNAGLTIMAARSTGVQNGFLEPKTPSAVCCGAVNYRGTPQPVFLTHSKLRPELPSDALDLRAWTFQEEHLSKRKVIFTSRQLEWHCQREKFEEQEREQSYDHVRPRCTTPEFRSNDRYQPLAGLLEPDHAHSMKMSNYQWMEIVKKYSARQITFESDRLPAISGIARVYAAQTGQEYRAGLWSGLHFIDLLLWFPITDIASSRSNSTAPNPPYIAPSWSWLAAGCAVDFKGWIGVDTCHKHIAADLKCLLTPETDDPFGQLTYGHLDISAPAIRTTIEIIMAANSRGPSGSHVDKMVYLQDIFPEYKMKPLSGDRTWPRFHLDRSDYDGSMQVHCLILGYEWWHDEDYGMYGLLVTPVSLSKRTFRRVGMFELLPKFRFSDGDLDIEEVIAKSRIKMREFAQHSMTEQFAAKKALLYSLTHGQDSSSESEEERPSRASELLEEADREAQTIREDLEFHRFRIF